MRRLRYRSDGTKRRIAFAGDDSWLRLFDRDWFSFVDGVTSFFVADTRICDYNVTRHLDQLLRDASWDVMILHYLGVDHAGHLGGPDGPLMSPKLREMDDVVARLWRHVVQRDAEDGLSSLMVVLGDHGMTATGNHGGSSAAETSAVR